MMLKKVHHLCSAETQLLMMKGKIPADELAEIAVPYEIIQLPTLGGAERCLIQIINYKL